MDESARWIRTNEAEDVAASLRHALRCREFVLLDSQAWKWLALALHSALQGACVCRLVTTASPVGAVAERNAAEWLEYFEKSSTEPNMTTPRTYLLSLPELLKAARKPGSAGDGSGESGITVADDEVQWLTRFHNEIRNQFVHFEPRGWSLDISGIPELSKVIVKIIRDIMELGWAFRHQDAGWKSAVFRDLTALASPFDFDTLPHSVQE